MGEGAQISSKGLKISAPVNFCMALLPPNPIYEITAAKQISNSGWLSLPNWLTAIPMQGHSHPEMCVNLKRSARCPDVWRANNQPTLIFIIEKSLNVCWIKVTKCSLPYGVKLSTRNHPKKLVFHCAGKFLLSFLNSQSPLFQFSSRATLSTPSSISPPAPPVNLLGFTCFIFSSWSSCQFHYYLL